MATSNTYDAIVIGSGISGGWAAKELCDHGLKTLVLERGAPPQKIRGSFRTVENYQYLFLKKIRW